MSFIELVQEADRRWKALTDGDMPWIRVGTALCGKAAGCDDVLRALELSLRRQGIAAQVSEVGCLGPCFAEPLVDVKLPGGPRIIYRNVTPETVEEIVSSHIVLGTPVE